MNELLKDLNEKYCRELNEAWLLSIGSFDGQNLRIEQFTPFNEKVKEAWQDGYRFQPHYDFKAFIRDRIMGRPEEQELLQFPAWNNVAHINSMVDASRKEKADWVLANLKNLRKQYTDSAMKEFATAFVKQKGPFYMRGDVSVILAYGHLGDVVAELLLIILMNYLKNEPGISLKGGVSQ